MQSSGNPLELENAFKTGQGRKKQIGRSCQNSLQGDWYSNGSSWGLESWIFVHVASWSSALVLVSPQELRLNSRIQTSGELQRFICWPVMPDITREFTELSVLPILNKGLQRLVSHWESLTTEFCSPFPYQCPFSLCYSSKQTIPNSDREQLWPIQVPASRCPLLVHCSYIYLHLPVCYHTNKN